MFLKVRALYSATPVTAHQAEHTKVILLHTPGSRVDWLAAYQITRRTFHDCKRRILVHKSGTVPWPLGNLFFHDTIQFEGGVSPLGEQLAISKVIRARIPKGAVVVMMDPPPRIAHEILSSIEGPWSVVQSFMIYPSSFGAVANDLCLYQSRDVTPELQSDRSYIGTCRTLLQVAQESRNKVLDHISMVRKYANLRRVYDDVSETSWCCV